MSGSERHDRNPSKGVTRRDVLRTGAAASAATAVGGVSALPAFTRENAWFLNAEDDTGSIETGKQADLAVLNKDYFTIPDDEIPQLRCVLTVVDGDTVHDTGEVQ